VALFGVLIWRVGVAAIGHLLYGVGWWALLLLVPQGLVMLCETSGWWFAFSRDGCPLRYSQLFRLNLAAKAIHQLTPSLSQVGELVKIHLLHRAGVLPDLASASVVTAKTTIVAAELAFVAVGFTVSLSTMTIDPAVTILGVAGVGTLALALGGVLVWLRFGLFRPVVWLGRSIPALGRFFNRHGPLFVATDAIVQDYLVWHRRRFWISSLAFLAGWLGGALSRPGSCSGSWAFLRMPAPRC
jgi:hypothetical protein